jgi:hypothetical protein
MRSAVENDINAGGIDKGRDADMDAVIKQKVFELYWHHTNAIL